MQRILLLLSIYVTGVIAGYYSHDCPAERQPRPVPATPAPEPVQFRASAPDLHPWSELLFIDPKGTIWL